MKELTAHRGDLLNDEIEIRAFDPSWPGGAHIKYFLRGKSETNIFLTVIKFQNGPIHALTDMNGLSNEALLAVLIDRLEGFQSGPFACMENEMARLHFVEALRCLKSRSKSRTKRGVSGTLEP